MQELIFASANKYKAEEIEAALPAGFHILIMKEAGITEEIPEPFSTLEENSAHKAAFLFERLNKNCFSEDTGLEVDALNGEPGVKSARYAGEDKSFEKNIEKLMQNLEGHTNRSARFRTVFTLILNGQQYQFEGICNGMITEKSSGTGAAATISLIKELRYKDTVMKFDTDQWKISPEVKRRLTAIREGKEADTDEWMYKI